MPFKKRAFRIRAFCKGIQQGIFERAKGHFHRIDKSPVPIDTAQRIYRCLKEIRLTEMRRPTGPHFCHLNLQGTAVILRKYGQRIFYCFNREPPQNVWVSHKEVRAFHNNKRSLNKEPVSYTTIQIFVCTKLLNCNKLQIKHFTYKPGVRQFSCLPGSGKVGMLFTLRLRPVQRCPGILQGC